MLNRITIMGRLTKDPELRHTQSGKAVASFAVACDRDIKNQSGERECDFIDCVAWAKTAEFCAQHTSKGSLIAVDGRLQFRDWEDRDGNKRRSAEVLVSSIYFGERKTEENVTKAKPVELDEDDPDLPF